MTENQRQTISHRDTDYQTAAHSNGDELFESYLRRKKLLKLEHKLKNTKKHKETEAVAVASTIAAVAALFSTAAADTILNDSNAVESPSTDSISLLSGVNTS